MQAEYPMFKKKKIMSREMQSVRSRISWGAVFGGFFVALVALVVLTALGTAARLTVLESAATDTGALGGTMLIYQAAVAFFSLFIGGWACSRFMARETRTEAVCSGLILWGVSFLALLVLTVNGISLSLSSLMGVNMVFSHYVSALELQHMAEAMELSAEQYVVLEGMMRDSLREANLVAMTWWSFAGLLISIAATVGGSLLGYRPMPVKAEAVVDVPRARVAHLTRVKI